MDINKLKVGIAICSLTAILACNDKPEEPALVNVFPVMKTEQTPNDTDDPAIWYNKKNPEKSLILGTDKGDSTGGIFVFNLDGNMESSKSIRNLKRPNNIDVEYGFNFGGKPTDIAVFTERGTDCIRVISLPDCQFIDNGGIPVFADDSLRAPMGIGLYKDRNNDVYAFVSRKTGPPEGYIYQYKLTDGGGSVIGTKVRALGKYSGKKEIEAVAVDDEKGYLYYSDETVGVRKYHADVENGNAELALFATNGITSDHEGLSIYKRKNGTGFIILSDQQANKFWVFTREGSKGNANDHQLVRIVTAQTTESDGSDILNMPLNDNFPHGIFVAMSSDRTFQFYKADDIVGRKSSLDWLLGN